MTDMNTNPGETATANTIRFNSIFNETNVALLKEYFQFYEKYYWQISEELTPQFANHPLFGPLIKMITPEQQKLQSQHSLEMQRAAIYEGKWDEYMEDLVMQGKMYAHMNITYSDWYEMVKIYKDYLLPYIKKDYATDTNKALNIISGLSIFIDYTMYGIAESFFHEKNEVIQQMNDELEQKVEQRTKELSDKNTNINDSINYAERIQIALLPHAAQLTELFPKSFILAKPCHIVSGDFFSCYQRRNKKIILVADCTGHGVPGALMSIIGNNLLNQIIVNEHIENASEILELLDARLSEALKGVMGEVKDGMDIALCVIDTYFNEIHFSGANNSLFLSGDDGKITELKSDRHPIGGGIQKTDKKFETKRFPIIPGQRIYLSSDGYYSQFGGEQGKKFMKSRFKQTLEELQPLPIEEQQSKLNRLFTEWSGKQEQTDDVLVMGIEL